MRRLNSPPQSTALCQQQRPYTALHVQALTSSPREEPSAAARWQPASRSAPPFGDVTKNAGSYWPRGKSGRGAVTAAAVTRTGFDSTRARRRLRSPLLGPAAPSFTPAAAMALSDADVQKQVGLGSAWPGGWLVGEGGGRTAACRLQPGSPLSRPGRAAVFSA